MGRSYYLQPQENYRFLASPTKRVLEIGGGAGDYPVSVRWPGARANGWRESSARTGRSRRHGIWPLALESYTMSQS